MAGPSAPDVPSVPIVLDIPGIANLPAGSLLPVPLGAAAHLHEPLEATRVYAGGMPLPAASLAPLKPTPPIPEQPGMPSATPTTASHAPLAIHTATGHSSPPGSAVTGRSCLLPQEDPALAAVLASLRTAAVATPPQPPAASPAIADSATPQPWSVVALPPLPQ